MSVSTRAENDARIKKLHDEKRKEHHVHMYHPSLGPDGFKDFTSKEDLDAALKADKQWRDTPYSKAEIEELAEAEPKPKRNQFPNGPAGTKAFKEALAEYGKENED